MAGKSRISWEAVRQEYETVGTTVNVLSVKYGISCVSIYSHIKAEEWKKVDLDKEEHDQEDDGEDIFEPDPDEEPPDPEEVARLQMESAVYAAKLAVARLLRELDRKTPQIGEIDRLIHDETLGDPVYRRRKVLRYVLTFPSRCNAAKLLASAIKTLYEIEMMAKGVLPGNRSKKANLQAAADRLTGGKFDVPDIMLKGKSAT